jgi:DNA-binding FadR family transcriptional regulator
MPPQRFDPLQSRRTFEEILARLRDAFRSGQLSQGDRLPAERELAEQFGVSRASVREAIRVLEALGVVTVKPGPDNGALLVADAAGAFRSILEYQLELRGIRIASLVEFRIVLESWSARAAAERAAPGTLERAGRLVGEMAAAELAPAAFQRLDAAFHLEIARASANELLALTLEGARTTTDRVMLEALSAAPDWEATKGRLVGEHAAILQAVARGEATRAADLMTAHIRDFYSGGVVAGGL